MDWLKVLPEKMPRKVRVTLILTLLLSGGIWTTPVESMARNLAFVIDGVAPQLVLFLAIWMLGLIVALTFALRPQKPAWGVTPPPPPRQKITAAWGVIPPRPPHQKIAASERSSADRPSK